MSVKFQSFQNFNNVFNIPSAPTAGALAISAFQVVGTPTSTQLDCSAINQGVLVEVSTTGSFEYPNGLPKTGADFGKIVGTVSSQEVKVNGLLLEKKTFSPAINGQLNTAADTLISAAQELYAGNDTFIGMINPGKDGSADCVDGFGGNDVFFGNGVGKSDDIFYGGAGVDTSVLRGKSTSYTIANASVWNEYTKKSDLLGITVTDKTGLDGRQQLTGVERLQFTDGTLALDFNRGDNGYKAAMLIGAAFGKDKVAAFFAPGIQLFDSGMTTDAVATLITDLKLIENTIGSTSNQAFVGAVYKNVMGLLPDALSEALYTRYLDSGAMSKSQLLTLAAGVGTLENQINLTGLQTNGILYSVFI